jgi:hypothetical protein
MPCSAPTSRMQSACMAHGHCAACLRQRVCKQCAGARAKNACSVQSAAVRLNHTCSSPRTGADARRSHRWQMRRRHLLDTELRPAGILRGVGLEEDEAVLLLQAGHPGGDLGAVERNVQAPAHLWEPEAQRAPRERQAGPFQLLQRHLESLAHSVQRRGVLWHACGAHSCEHVARIGARGGEGGMHATQWAAGGRTGARGAVG